MYRRMRYRFLLLIFNLATLLSQGSTSPAQVALERNHHGYLPDDVIIARNDRVLLKKGHQLVPKVPIEDEKYVDDPFDSNAAVPKIYTMMEMRRSLFKLQDDFVDVCYGNLTSTESIQDGNITTIDVYNFITLVDDNEYPNFNGIPAFIQLEWMWTLCPPTWMSAAKCLEELEEMNELGSDYGFDLTPDNQKSVFGKVKSFCKRIWYHYRTTDNPSKAPSQMPSTSKSPSASPSSRPTMLPSQIPSNIPTLSRVPTSTPSFRPSKSPTPSTSPSYKPSLSMKPSLSPSNGPSISIQPSKEPSSTPSISRQPSAIPSGIPSYSVKPSLKPSFEPTISSQPSSKPSYQPSISIEPSSMPSSIPTKSILPSQYPSFTPTKSIQPSFNPSSVPSESSSPSNSPSSKPSISIRPTTAPSNIPSVSPAPSMGPSSQPSLQPSIQPTFRDEYQVNFKYILGFNASNMNALKLTVDKDGIMESAKNATGKILTGSGVLSKDKDIRRGLLRGHRRIVAFENGDPKNSIENIKLQDLTCPESFILSGSCVLAETGVKVSANPNIYNEEMVKEAVLSPMNTSMTSNTFLDEMNRSEVEEVLFIGEGDYIPPEEGSQEKPRVGTNSQYVAALAIGVAFLLWAALACGRSRTEDKREETELVPNSKFFESVDSDQEARDEIKSRGLNLGSNPDLNNRKPSAKPLPDATPVLNKLLSLYDTQMPTTEKAAVSDSNSSSEEGVEGDTSMLLAPFSNDVDDESDSSFNQEDESEYLAHPELGGSLGPSLSGLVGGSSARKLNPLEAIDEGRDSDEGLTDTKVEDIDSTAQRNDYDERNDDEGKELPSISNSDEVVEAEFGESSVEREQDISDHEESVKDHQEADDISITSGDNSLAEVLDGDEGEVVHSTTDGEASGEGDGSEYDESIEYHQEGDISVTSGDNSLQEVLGGNEGDGIQTTTDGEGNGSENDDSIEDHQRSQNDIKADDIS